MITVISRGGHSCILQSPIFNFVDLKAYHVENVIHHQVMAINKFSLLGISRQSSDLSPISRQSCDVKQSTEINSDDICDRIYRKWHKKTQTSSEE